MTLGLGQVHDGVWSLTEPRLGNLQVGSIVHVHLRAHPDFYSIRLWDPRFKGPWSIVIPDRLVDAPSYDEAVIIATKAWDDYTTKGTVKRLGPKKGYRGHQPLTEVGDIKLSKDTTLPEVE